MDSTLAFEAQAKSVVDTCFGLMRSFKPILGLLDSSTCQTIIQTVILSQLDYCNIFYLGTNRSVIRRLQLAQNAAARLLFVLSKFCPVFALLHHCTGFQ